MPKAFERDDKRILLQQSNTNNFSCIYLNIQDINIELCGPILVLQENVSKKKPNNLAELQGKWRGTLMERAKARWALLNYPHHYIPLPGLKEKNPNHSNSLTQMVELCLYIATIFHMKNASKEMRGDVRQNWMKKVHEKILVCPISLLQLRQKINNK